MILLSKVISSLIKNPLLELILTGLLFLSVALMVTYPLVRNLAHSVLECGDTLQVAYVQAWNAQNLFVTIPTLFNAPIMHPLPLPLTYIEHMRGLMILFAPVYWLSGNPILAFNLSLILGYTISGLGCFGFLRALLPKNAAGWCGACVAGGIFAYNPWRLIQFGHLEQVCALWIGPLLLCLVLYLEQKRSRYLFGFVAFTVMQTLISYYYVLICGVLIVAGVAYVLLLKRTCLHTVGSALCTVSIIMLIVHLPLALPYIQNQSARLISPEEQHFFSLQTRQDLLGSRQSAPLRRFLFGSAAIEVPTMERMLDAGIISYTLAAISIVLACRSTPAYRRAVLVSVSTVATGLILCMGPYLQIGERQIPMPFGLLRLLPGIGSLRGPARLWQISLVAIAILSGLAVWRLSARLKPKVAILLCISSFLAIALFLRASPVRSTAMVSVPPVCSWIDKVLPDNAVLLHLPWVFEGRVENRIFVWPDAEKMLCAIYHRRKMVNGFLAYVPPEQLIRQQCIAGFPSPQAMDCVHKTGVTHILVNREDVSVDVSRQLDAPGEALRLGLVELYRDATHILYRVNE